jgi:integrase
MFESACKTDATRKTYTKLLDYFLVWAKQDHESLLKIDDSELHMMLEDYMMYCKRRYSTSTVNNILSAIEKFLFVNDKVINKKKLLMFLPDKLYSKQRAITTEEIRIMLKYSGSKRNRAIILVLASTGCRPEAIADLKIRDISEMPDDCMSIVFYAGHYKQYQSFFYSEVTTAIKDYLDERKQDGEKLEDNSRLFRQLSWKKDSEQALVVTGIESIIENIIKHAGIKRIKQANGRYDLPVCNGFRNRFNTILMRTKDFPYAIKEQFMDHKYRLEPSYLHLTKLELFDYYKKSIPELMINEESRLKLENENKQKQIEQLESDKDIEIKKMKLQIDSMLEMFSTAKALMKTNH